MSPVVVYILAYLAEVGETWTEASESDPAHGRIVLTNAAKERLTFSYRFNSGDPQWFASHTPKRLSAQLDGLYPLYSPPKREVSDG